MLNDEDLEAVNSHISEMNLAAAAAAAGYANFQQLVGVGIVNNHQFQHAAQQGSHMVGQGNNGTRPLVVDTTMTGLGNAGDGNNDALYDM
jgi:hypothetical protein